MEQFDWITCYLNYVYKWFITGCASDIEIFGFCMKPLLMYDIVVEHCKNAANHMLETIVYISHIISNSFVTKHEATTATKNNKKRF